MMTGFTAININASPSVESWGGNAVVIDKLVTDDADAMITDDADGVVSGD
jgi:hypothetical protein